MYLLRLNDEWDVKWFKNGKALFTDKTYAKKEKAYNEWYMNNACKERKKILMSAKNQAVVLLFPKCHIFRKW